MLQSHDSFIPKLPLPNYIFFPLDYDASKVTISASGEWGKQSHYTMEGSAAAKQLVCAVKDIHLHGGLAPAFAAAGGDYHHDWWHKEQEWSLEDGSVFYRKEYLDSVNKVGNRYPVNGDWAGKRMKFEDLPPSKQKEFPEFKEQYPDGIPFDLEGFPDFSKHTVKRVQIKVEGVHSKDERAANIAAGYLDTPKGYSWHHHQDGITMELIDTRIHDAIRHTGGVAMKKAKNKGGS